MRLFRLAMCVLLMPVLGSAASAENLDDAWSAALRADQRLAAAQSRVEAARQGLAAAKSELGPTASAETGYDARDKVPAYNATTLFGVPAELPISQRSSASARVEVEQPLYTSGRIRADIDAGRAKLCEEQFELTATVERIRLNVAEEYSNVLHARRMVEVSKAAEVSLSAHLRDLRNRVQQGMAITADLLAVEVAQANAAQRTLEDLNLQENAESAYNRALSRPLGTPVVLEELQEPTERPDLEAVTRRAIEQRPELARLASQARSLREEATSIRSTYYPQVALRATSEYQDNIYQVNPEITTVAVVGQWNFFDSGQRRHRTRKLEEQADAVAHSRADMLSVICLQVRQAWNDLCSRQERIMVTRFALNSADENVRVARSRYSQGIGTNTDVLDAETRRTQLYRNYYDSLYSSQVASMRLRWSAGEL